MSCEVKDEREANDSEQHPPLRVGVPYVIREWRVRVRSAPTDMRDWCCMMSYNDCKIIWTQIYIFLVVVIAVFTMGSLAYWLLIEPNRSDGTLFDHHQISDTSQGGTGKYQQEVDTDTDTESDEEIAIINDNKYKLPNGDHNRFSFFGFDFDAISISPIHFVLIQFGVLLCGCFICLCCTIFGVIGYEFILKCKVKMEKCDKLMQRLFPDPKQVALQKIDHENVQLICNEIK